MLHVAITIWVGLLSLIIYLQFWYLPEKPKLYYKKTQKNLEIINSLKIEDYHPNIIGFDGFIHAIIVNTLRKGPDHIYIR